MIIPSNIYLTEDEKIEYEKFIKRNHSKIKGVLVLINLTPFKSNLKFDDYYAYITKIVKQYNLKAIGFFNETVTIKFSPTLKDDIISFEKEFIQYYKAGIKTIIRPYSWYNYNFYKFDKLNFHIPTESNKLNLIRVIKKEIFFKHLIFLEKGIDKNYTKREIIQSKYKNTLSLAHTDSTYSGKLFYECFKNNSDKFISEIDDIYFGKEFIYDDGLKYLTYGNVMGVSASDEQIEYLFKIQDEFNISISLTLNAMNAPLDLLYDKEVLKAFMKFIKVYYDKGLRVITISDIHLMKTGILQKQFPLLRFKNTVNHKISDTQSFVNFANLGYDYIQLDRSLSRNISELKKIKKENEKYKKKLYLLASEYCMYNCPFKDEHDLINEQLQDSHFYFNDKFKLSHISCDNWRSSKASQLPRIGVDIILKDEKMADDYLCYIDVFKMSGRMVNLDTELRDSQKMFFCGYDSLEDKLRNDIEKSRFYISYRQRGVVKENIYSTKDGQNLLDILTNCKNQCYDCHKCEDVFGMEHFDTLIDIPSEF